MSAGERRYGQPRTDEEREARHLALYGSEDLPSRGSGLTGSNPGSAWLGWLLAAVVAWLVLRKR